MLIIDSLSHVWMGQGGSLEKQGKIAARTGNSYTAWRDVTPEHNRLIDTILQSPCHIICNFRAKQEYVQTKDSNGKILVKNVGLGLQFRDSAEYELSTLFMLDQDHTANASKDRTGLFDGKYCVITPDTGKKIYQWLASGQPEQQTRETEKADPGMTTMDMLDTVIKRRCTGLSADEKKQVAEEIRQITGGTSNYKSVTDPDMLKTLYEHFIRKEEGENV